MQKEHFLITITNISTNTTEIVNHLTTKKLCQDVFIKLFNIINSLSILSYTTDEHNMTIFEPIEITRKGWIYNSTIQKSLPKYKLSIIKVSSVSERLKNNSETQTTFTNETFSYQPYSYKDKLTSYSNYYTDTSCLDAIFSSTTDSCQQPIKDIPLLETHTNNLLLELKNRFHEPNFGLNPDSTSTVLHIA